MTRGLMTYHYLIFGFFNKLFFISLLWLLGCDSGTAQRNMENKSKANPKVALAAKKVQAAKATVAPDFTLADLDGNWARRKL